MSGNRIPFLEYSSTFDTLCSSAVSPVEELAKTNAVAARILSVVKSNFPEKFEHNAAHVTPILARYSTPHVNCPSSVSFLPKVSATSEHQNSVLNSFPIHSVIAGPSGAGKSSIVNMISNFIQAGRIMNSQFYGREMQEDLQQLAWGQHDDTVLSLSSDEEEGDDEENDEEDNTKMTIGEFMKKRLQHPDIFHVFKVKATSKEQTVVTQVQSARNGLVVIDEGQRYFLKAQEANDPFARAVLTATDEHKASILFSGGTSILTLGIWRQNGYTQQRVQKGNHRAEYSTCLENGLIRRTHITIISQAPPQIVSEEASCISPSRFKESADRAANFSVPAFSPEPRRPRPSLPTAGAHVAEKSSSKGETIWISDVDSQGEPQEERIELESVAFVINLFWRLLDAKTEMWKKQNHTVLSLFVESTATTNSECERIHREYLRVCETMGVPRAEAERFLPQIKLQKMASELTVGLFGFNIAIKILQGNAELLSYCNHIAKELPPLTSSFNGNRGVKAIIHSALVDKIRAAVEDEWKENVRQTDDQPNLLMHLEDRNSNIYARAIPDNIKPLVFAELKKQVDIMISLFGSADPTPSQHPSTTAIDGRKQMLASSSGPDSSLVQPPVTVMQAKPPAASSVMVMQTKSEIVCLQLLNEAEVASRTEVHSSDIMANNKTVPQFCAVKVLESVSKLLSMNDNSVKRNMENDESYSLEAPVQPTCYNFKKVVPIDTFILPGTRKSKYQKNVNLNNFPKTIQAAYTLLNKIGEMVPIEEIGDTSDKAHPELWNSAKKPLWQLSEVSAGDGQTRKKTTTTIKFGNPSVRNYIEHATKLTDRAFIAEATTVVALRLKCFSIAAKALGLPVDALNKFIEQEGLVDTQSQVDKSRATLAGADMEDAPVEEEHVPDNDANMEQPAEEAAEKDERVAYDAEESSFSNDAAHDHAIVENWSLPSPKVQQKNEQQKRVEISSALPKTSEDIVPSRRQQPRRRCNNLDGGNTKDSTTKKARIK